jgi:hypothetical protein
VLGTSSQHRGLSCLHRFGSVDDLLHLSGSPGVVTLCAKTGLTHRNKKGLYSVTSSARVSSVFGTARPTIRDRNVISYLDCRAPRAD